MTGLPPNHQLGATTVEMLGHVKLLSSFQPNELAGLVSRGELLRFEAHSNIVIEGELSWGLFVIMDGMVGVLKTNKLTGEQYDIAQLRAGSFFGEMSLIDEQPRSASVKALTDTLLFSVPKEAFWQLLRAAPGLKDRFFENCVKMLVTRLRELDDNYVISQYQLWKTALKREAG